ncbi:hypothetical protein F2P81_007503 [Scophthalmus maximus]|uniref:Uncharacterized protein n=1 Tax=Scophthalmus maximus TaxID=52904 RepID=A0A6A4T4K0_SCOMX|nr:hypothetical protein F2P81_007503 [Scophthalmus maximus]
MVFTIMKCPAESAYGLFVPAVTNELSVTASLIPHVHSGCGFMIFDIRARSRVKCLHRVLMDFGMKLVISNDESDEPELDGVAVGLLTVISDHDTIPVHYHPVRISVLIESDAVVSLPRLGDAFLVIFGLIYTSAIPKH